MTVLLSIVILVTQIAFEAQTPATAAAAKDRVEIVLFTDFRVETELAAMNKND